MYLIEQPGTCLIRANYSTYLMNMLFSSITAMWGSRNVVDVDKVPFFFGKFRHMHQFLSLVFNIIHFAFEMHYNDLNAVLVAFRCIATFFVFMAHLSLCKYHWGALVRGELTQRLFKFYMATLACYILINAIGSFVDSYYANTNRLIVFLVYTLPLSVRWLSLVATFLLTKHYGGDFITNQIIPLFTFAFTFLVIIIVVEVIDSRSPFFADRIFIVCSAFGIVSVFSYYITRGSDKKGSLRLPPSPVMTLLHMPTESSTLIPTRPEHPDSPRNGEIEIGDEENDSGLERDGDRDDNDNGDDDDSGDKTTGRIISRASSGDATPTSSTPTTPPTAPTAPPPPPTCSPKPAPSQRHRTSHHDRVTIAPEDTPLSPLSSVIFATSAAAVVATVATVSDSSEEIIDTRNGIPQLLLPEGDVENQLAGQYTTAGSGERVEGREGGRAGGRGREGKREGGRTPPVRKYNGNDIDNHDGGGITPSASDSHYNHDNHYNDHDHNHHHHNHHHHNHHHHHHHTPQDQRQDQDRDHDKCQDRDHDNNQDHDQDGSGDHDHTHAQHSTIALTTASMVQGKLFAIWVEVSATYLFLALAELSFSVYLGAPLYDRAQHTPDRSAPSWCHPFGYQYTSTFRHAQFFIDLVL